jgi:hypothetical protein
MFGLLGLVSDQWFMIAAGAVLYLCWQYFGNALDRDSDRREIVSWLERPRGAELYADAVNGVLDRIDRRLTPDNDQDNPNPKPDAPFWKNLEWLIELQVQSPEAAQKIGRSAWGWTLFDLVLLLAVAYPIVLLVVFWGVTGDEGRIGSLVVLPGERPAGSVANFSDD